MHATDIWSVFKEEPLSLCKWLKWVFFLGWLGSDVEMGEEVHSQGRAWKKSDCGLGIWPGNYLPLEVFRALYKKLKLVSQYMMARVSHANSMRSRAATPLHRQEGSYIFLLTKAHLGITENELQCRWKDGCFGFTSWPVVTDAWSCIKGRQQLKGWDTFLLYFHFSYII